MYGRMDGWICRWISDGPWQKLVTNKIEISDIFIYLKSEEKGAPDFSNKKIISHFLQNLKMSSMAKTSIFSVLYPCPWQKLVSTSSPLQKLVTVLLVTSFWNGQSKLLDFAMDSLQLLVFAMDNILIFGDNIILL